MTQTPQTTTRLLARVLGPFLVLVPVTAAARAPQMQTMLTDFESNPLWPWIVGAFILLLGLIIVALHQVWTDPVAIAVSALGWLLVVRGVVLLVFPAAFVSAANAVIGTGVVWQIGYVGVACLGLYLTWAGWRR
ncbi:MAG: hypothetical protein KDB56_14740 [Mycobacterium sp.]|nr:hypothetical protein [Mycobacterium sp.]